MRIKLFILIFFIGSVLFAQSELDSLLLSVEKNSENEVSKAIEDGLMCLHLSQSPDLVETHVLCGIHLAKAYYNFGEPWKAEKIILSAISSARGNDLSVYLFNSLAIYISVLSATNRPDKAWPLANELLTIAEDEEDPKLLAIAYFTVGDFILYYDEKEDDDLAFSYLEKALNHFKTDGNLGMAATCMETIAQFTTDTPKANKYTQEAIAIYKELNEEVKLAWAYCGLARHYNKTEQYDLSINASKKALELHQKNKVKGGVADVLHDMGVVYLKQGEVHQAIQYLEESLVIAKEIPLHANIFSSSSVLAKAYAQINDYPKAYTYLLQTNAYKDSTFHESINQQLAESNAKYENEQLEKTILQSELEIARQKNIRNRVLVLATVSLLIAIGFFQFFHYHQKQKKKEADIALAYQSLEADRLRKLNEFKTNFFTNISHELRTPLTLILGPISDVIESIHSKPIRDKLGIVKKNGERLLNLVNEIMDLSKVEVGKLESHTSEVTLNDFIKRIFSAFESLAYIRRIQYKINLNIEDVTVLLDRDKFEKIIHNLLSNAIKYTGAGGKVSLDVYKDDERYIFDIKDNGQGIHPDDQAHVFDRYYQARNSTHSLQGGTGIGLALAKELAQLLGGDISMKSELEKGSCFSLSIALVEIEKTKKHQKAQKEAPTSPLFTPSYSPISIQGEKPKVLVVEDHPEMGKYILEILSNHYQCVLATDGTEALKQMKLTTFDCITSDVMMPNMDGFMLRSKINERPEWKQIPFLLLTARHLEEDRIKGFQLGIDDYITKPFSTRELHARIHNLISNKLERSNYKTEEEDQAPLSVDQNMLVSLEQVVLDHLDDDQFKVENLATAVHYSPKQVGRIIKKHTGMSSVQFILEIRLQKARIMLEKRLCASVIEAQYAVGIQSTSYFTRKFTERFGKNPSSFF